MPGSYSQEITFSLCTPAESAAKPGHAYSGCGDLAASLAPVLTGLPRLIAKQTTAGS